MYGIARSGPLCGPIRDPQALSARRVSAHGEHRVHSGPQFGACIWFVQETGERFVVETLPRLGFVVAARQDYGNFTDVAEVLYSFLAGHDRHGEIEYNQRDRSLLFTKD